MLNDKKIRDALINRLLNRKLSRNNIFEEIAVKRGLGIADVVANFKTPHCYEIKSDVDSLTRLKAQSEYFSDAFKKVTLVTTKRHLTKAELIVPEWWGITIAEQKKDKVTLKSHRKSGLNPKNTTTDLLSMLWNNELKSALNSLNVSFKSSDNRALLVNKLASSTSQKSAEKIFVQTMSKRQKN
ncbi:sce7726 family protein [Vibrio vulnificus]|nr:sce7726 family protein [Vibrio vulnificus]EIA1336689.1 sce7726 family protein [Vibrio vulnificus]EIU7594677.1 sce7726 family protein [Vibrio vulnificus]EIX4869583.1 sce7726 family protein [Vibrio vulnificus]EJE8687517.1 sce7726 family protein [Vibrio vulnificus]